MRYEIEGGSLPVAILHLEPGEVILSELGGRTWVRGEIETETVAEGGVGKSLGRVFAGESLFMSRYTAKTAAEIAFASCFPGRIEVRELAAGESIICQKHAFLCGSGDVQLNAIFQKKLSAGLLGGEGFVMQKVTGPGIVFLEIDGYCKEYDLAPGEELVCDTGLLAFMDESCQLDIRVVKGIKNKFLGGEGLVDTVITGPGKVYLQTMSVPRLAGLVAPYIPSK